MTFSQGQIKNLSAKLSGRMVKTREVEGKELSYLEGWHVIAEANRIFGFDAWDRHTVSNRCVWEGMKRGCPSCAYVAKVRITVRAGHLTVTREGSGSGQGSAISPADAHDMALKAAETDATKRALATFGNPFGLALYDKEQTGVRKIRPGRSSKRAAVHLTAGSAGNAREDPPQCGAVICEDRGRKSASGDHHQARQAGEAINGASAQPVDGARSMAKSSLQRAASKVFAPDKSALAIAEPRRVRRPEHIRFVASQPCLICGRRPSEAHHLTFAQPRGLSLKSSDEFTVPLCRAHHRQLHATGDEEAWWHERGIDAVGVAADFWNQSMGVQKT